VTLHQKIEKMDKWQSDPGHVNCQKADTYQYLCIQTHFQLNIPLGSRWIPRRSNLLNTIIITEEQFIIASSKLRTKYTTKLMIYSVMIVLMDHNMVLSYEYAKRNRRRRRTNAPLLWAISMAMVRRWSDTFCIAQCSMSSATPEATGRHHRGRTTRSVLPRRPPGQLQTKQRCTMHPVLRCGGTIPCASPNGGGPGLSWKPLNSAIGRALAPIASIGHANAGVSLISL
jgi:hypothetical protein